MLVDPRCAVGWAGLAQSGSCGSGLSGWPGLGLSHLVRPVLTWHGHACLVVAVRAARGHGPVVRVALQHRFRRIPVPRCNTNSEPAPRCNTDGPPMRHEQGRRAARPSPTRITRAPTRMVRTPARGFTSDVPVRHMRPFARRTVDDRRLRPHGEGGRPMRARSPVPSRAWRQAMISRSNGCRCSSRGRRRGSGEPPSLTQ